MGNRFIVPVVITLILFAAHGCGNSEDSEPGGSGKKIIPEGLDQGFVISMLRGNTGIEVVDGVDLGLAPYEFFMTLPNPADAPIDLTFKNTRITDLHVSIDESTIFKYSTSYPGESEQSTFSIPGKSKQSWRLHWSGRLDDGSYPANGVYSFTFMLNSDPPFVREVTGVKLRFPGNDDEPPADE